MKELVQRHPYALLLPFVAAMYLFQLGAFPLLGPDEPRYGQVAREMAERGDFVSPTLGGRLWAEKPPLLYWSMMLTSAVLGLSEWSLRLPSVLAALVSLAALCAAGRRQVGPSHGFWAALVLATCGGFWAFAHGATTDMLLVACLTVGLCQLAPGLLRGRLETGPLLGAAAAFALAVLAKGLIGLVLPLLIVGAWVVLTRSLPSVRLTSLFLAAALFLGIVSVWFVPVILRHGWSFIETFFISHHFSRYLSHDFDHPAPPWYYLKVLPLGALPWTPLLLLELARLAHLAMRREWAELRGSGFAALWALVPVAFFSLSRSKLPGYVLPALPGVALLVAGALERGFAHRTRGFRVAVWAGLALAVLMGAAPLGLGLDWRARHLAALLGPVLAVATFALALSRRSHRVACLAIALGAGGGLTLFKLTHLPDLVLRISRAHVARTIARELAPGERVLAYHYYDHSITFYADARTLFDAHGNRVVLRSHQALADAMDDNETALVVTIGKEVDLLAADERFGVTRIQAWDKVELLRVRYREAIRPEPGSGRPPAPLR